uniref:Uncharacterized protein n=1 Tax=Xenopus tropicalis TaxID=8364 RepID=A0A6I8RJ02_XENTR
MKVLALVVLVIAISGMEAGVVRREVPSVEELTKLIQTWAEYAQTQAQEWVAKIQNADINGQAGQIMEEAKAKLEPFQTQMLELYTQFTDKKA